LGNYKKKKPWARGKPKIVPEPITEEKNEKKLTLEINAQLKSRPK